MTKTCSVTEELSPCPFCGNPAHLDDFTDRPVKSWVLRHGAPNCPVMYSEYLPTREAALKIWNTRAQPKPEVAPDTRIKTTVVATYEDLRWQLHTIAGHLRGMNRWKEATRVQKISDSMWPKGDIIPQPMIPRSNHG